MWVGVYLTHACFDIMQQILVKAAYMSGKLDVLGMIENNVLCGAKCTDYSPRQSIGACIPWYVPKVFFIGPTLSDLIKGRIFKNWILAFFCFVFLESVYFFVLFSEAILCKTFFVFCTGHYYCKHCK